MVLFPENVTTKNQNTHVGGIFVNNYSNLHYVSTTKQATYDRDISSCVFEQIIRTESSL